MRLKLDLTPIGEKLAIADRAVDWLNKSDAQLRIQCGELTAQEIRTLRAVLSVVVGVKHPFI